MQRHTEASRSTRSAMRAQQSSAGDPSKILRQTLRSGQLGPDGGGGDNDGGGGVKGAGT